MNGQKQAFGYALLGAALIFLLNHFWLFDFLGPLNESYFIIVVLINLVVMTLLANATYYTSRVHIDDMYVSISFCSFILITDFIFALTFILQGETHWSELFIAMGKLFFVFGVLSLKWKKNTDGFIQQCLQNDSSQYFCTFCSNCTGV